MRATFTQDQLDIQKSVRSIVESDADQARAALDASWTRPGTDEVLLRDFGVLGVPETAGGVGSSLIDLLVAVETLGESLVPSQFPWHAAAVQLASSTGLVTEEMLEGRVVLTPAVDAPGVSGWADDAAADNLVRTLVPYAGAADFCVVLGADGVQLVEPASVTPRESFDPAVTLSDIRLSVAGSPVAAGDGIQRATLVAAAQLCGVAQGAIDLAAEYARTRQQFGRAIGSFQAVAFQLAEAVAVRKAAWDLTLHAAWAVETGRDEALAQVHAAKAAAGKAAVFAAERCIQVHGGMGITMEADPHLFLRRAFVVDAMFGRGSWHRRRVGELRVQQRRGAQSLS